jgi:hypothetical protein
MTIINSLSSSLRQKGNEENIETAQWIVEAENQKATKELAKKN